MTRQATFRPLLLATAVALALVLGAIAGFAGPVQALTTLLYDIDFSTPPHTVGSPPAVGAGPAPRDTVSSITFGSPTVVSSFGDLTDQPLKFDSFDGSGDQIKLSLDDMTLGSAYVIEAELEIDDVDILFRPFTVLLDTPQVRSVSFRSNGTVTTHVPFVFPGPPGAFDFDEKIDLKIQVDLSADTWEIFLNPNPPKG